ncbi:MAG: preprotein translocase subunit SecG [Pseudarcicella sp.]|jgi:preprotein translocase subunit SecG|nr:preprotein translocase subunit SecG [Pseudarcicella sp.]MBP6410671.1 preprotein translocase subunit SecG [Pseudarcicella sp.]
MFTTIITLIIILSALLVLVVLIQNPKGGGLSGEFGGAGASQMFGVKRTGDLLEQLTWGFSGAIVILVLVSKFTLSSVESKGTSINVEKAAKKTVTAPTPATTTAPDTNKK